MKADMKEIAELHASGFSCSQVVAYMCSDLSGIDKKMALSAMAGFGGGLRCGEVCGAVSGGVYSLGMGFSYSEESNSAAKEKISELTKEFTARFREEFGFLTCRELLEAGGREMCEKYMAGAIKLIHEITEREKTYGNL